MKECVKEVGLKIEEAADQTRWRGGGESSRGGDEVYLATFGNEEEPR